MKSSLNIFKFNKNISKNSQAVVNFTRQDLNRKWLNRVQQKANDAISSDAYSKLASLVDYYSKPATSSNNKIDWDYWTKTIRTESVVSKIQQKNQAFSEQKYNVDTLAARSAVASEKYESVGLFLRYNHDLWMKQYTDNLHALYGILHLGDLSLVTTDELLDYSPGTRETMAGWRETGYLMTEAPYYENGTTEIITSQFRYSNVAWQPYYHPVCAWERGLVCKHVLMSL